VTGAVDVIRRGEGRFFVGDDPAQALAEITFTREAGGRIVIDHTRVSELMKGRGLGSSLVMEVVALARSEGITIRPVCPFAKKLLEDPACADVLYRED